MAGAEVEDELEDADAVEDEPDEPDEPDDCESDLAAGFVSDLESEAFSDFFSAAFSDLVAPDSDEAPLPFSARLSLR